MAQKNQIKKQQKKNQEELKKQYDEKVRQEKIREEQIRKEQAAEQERIQREIKEQENRKKDTVNEYDKYDYQLIAAVDATINRFDALYNPMWNGKWYGIIHKDGVRFKNPNTTNTLSKITSTIYKVWKEFAIKKLEVNDLDNTKFKMNTGYNPGFHIENLSDHNRWINNRKNIREKLLQKFSEYFERDPSTITMLSRSMTNALFIKEKEKNTIILRLTGIERNELEDFKLRLSRELEESTNIADQAKGLVADISIDNAGVVSITYIYNYEGYKNEVLFAYKLYQDIDNGITPSLTNALIGVKMNGAPYKINLIDSRKMITSIIAGSRSGKGTMTMSLLADIFGAGGSVIYSDYKPDIGAMLWDLEREYSNHGVKFLALDMGSEQSEFTGSTPVRTGKMNLIDEDLEMADAFKVLRMIKLMQFVYIIGSNSSNIERMTGVSTKNVFFIMDELTSANASYCELLSYVNDQTNKYSAKANKAKATDDEKMKAAYYEKLFRLLNSTIREYEKGFNTFFGQSGIKTILIGQQLNSAWKIKGFGWANSLAGKLVGKSHLTISGRLQANKETYKFTDDQEKLADQSGVFVLSDKAPSPCDTTASKSLATVIDRAERFTQFRSYFSLVRNDFNIQEFREEGADAYLANHGNRFTSQFLNNYIRKDENTFNSVLNEIYDFENERNRDEISFSGLIKVMQQKLKSDPQTSSIDLMQNMGKGYRLADAVFKKMNIGSYNCIEEYLCDCSPDSIFTTTELVEMLNGIRPQESKYNDNSDVNIFNDNNFQGTVDDFHYETNNTQNNRYEAENNQRTINDNFRTINSNQEKETVYSGNVNVNDNPFLSYCTESNTDVLITTKEITKIIMNDIKINIGTPEMITNFEVTKDGVLKFNGIEYKPKFNKGFIDSLPQALKVKVVSGSLVDLYDLRQVYKFKNLEEFAILKESFAQGRARKEMGIGFRKKWSSLFNKMKRLQIIRIGTNIVYKRANPDTDVEHDTLNRFKNNKESTYSKNKDRLEKVWDSKPVRFLTSSIGWTMGVQVVYALASIMGPWGLVFGLIAAYNGYRTIADYRNAQRELTSSTKQINNRRNK